LIAQNIGSFAISSINFINDLALQNRMLVESFSGIRGIYGLDLTSDVAGRYAFAYYNYLSQKIGRGPIIVVGRDTRPSGSAVYKAVIESVTNVLDVGIIPIPALSLAVREFKADGGIMITASHNEPEFNGLKFLSSDGAVLVPNEMQTVINSFRKVKDVPARKPSIKIKDISSVYSKFIGNLTGTIENNYKVIADANGGTGYLLEKVAKDLGVKNIRVINQEQGIFKRKVEPTKESLAYLRDMIKADGAVFAAGFDCDADRVEILLDDGTIVDGNMLLAIIVDHMVGNKKGVVVVNDATSNIIRDICAKHGCLLKEVEVGEINVVSEMARLDSPIGGEGSNGGIIIPPSKGRDGIISFLMLLKILNDEHKTLKQKISEFPKYHTLQRKIAAKGYSKDKVKRHYKGFGFKETGDETGGLKVILDEKSFVWFRVSKTEPDTLRIISESESEEKSQEMMSQAITALQKE